MENLGYYNGKYDTLDKMMIPMNDRVCWFGDGVYDTGLCHNYCIFAIDEHIDRLFHSAEELRIRMPVSRQELRKLLEELVTKLDVGDLFVYFQVTRGTGMRNHSFPDGPANLWIMIRQAEIPDGTKPIRLITTEDTRFYHCNIKTLNLIPAVMASQKAQEAGCQEAIFYRPGGRITECAHSNVHILKNGILYTAPADHLILPGIARAHLLRMCQKTGIPVREESFYVEDLWDAEEVLVTSTSTICRYANEIDGRSVGGKKPELVKNIREALEEEFYSYCIH